MMRVREAVAEDIPAIAQLECATEGAAHWPESEYVTALDAEATPLRKIFVLEEAPRILGFVVAKFVAGTAEIENIAVDTSVRRCGGGRALLDGAIYWACHMEAEQIQLEVRAGNAAALGLYAALGFVETGRRPGYYAAPLEDAVLLSLPL